MGGNLTFEPSSSWRDLIEENLRGDDAAALGDFFIGDLPASTHDSYCLQQVAYGGGTVLVDVGGSVPVSIDLDQLSEITLKICGEDFKLSRDALVKTLAKLFPEFEQHLVAAMLSERELVSTTP